MRLVLNNKLTLSIKNLFGVTVIFFYLVSFAPAMEIVGQWGTGEYLDVYTAGTISCCAASGAGVDIINISNPKNPTLIANFDTSGESHGVFMTDNLVYIADGCNGLQIIDISTPAKPVLRGYLQTYNALQVMVVDNKAYVADAQNGLLIIDVSNPETPTLLGSYDTPGSAVDVFVSETTAYIADTAHGLQIINVGDPRNPVLLNNYVAPKKATGVWVKGSTAYIADNYQGLLVVNVKDPVHPQLISNIKTQVSKVQIVGNTAYLLNYANSLLCYDISDPAHPKLLSSGIQNMFGDSGVRDYENNIFVAGNTVYLASRAAGLQLADVTNPATPIWLGLYYNFSGYAADVWVTGSMAYLADEHNGLQIIDISSPETPLHLGNFNNCQANTIQVVGSEAYIGGARNFYVVDISDPSHPAELGKCALSGDAEDLFVINKNVYIAEGVDGLQIINISDPKKPEVIATYEMPGYSTRGINVVNTLAYVADSDGIEIIDLSRIGPTTPRIIGKYKTSGDAVDVGVAGSTAYIADGDKGLKIVDITDSAAPTLVSVYTPIGSTKKVQVVDNRAYLLNTGNLQIIDITDQAHPKNIDICDTTGSPGECQIVNDKAYIADGNSGRLLIIDLTAKNSNLYFPHAACTDGWQTEIAVINSGSQSVYENLTVYDKLGQAMERVIPVNLDPWQRNELTVTDYFSGDEEKKIAYLILTGGSHKVVGYTKFYHQNSGYRAALPAVSDTENDTLYIDHIASDQNWWTGIALLNTASETRYPVITFSDGRQKTITLAAGAHRSFTVRELFSGPQPQIGSATITNCLGIVGFELFGSNVTGHQLAGISISGKLDNTIYYPHIASDNNWWTGIAVYNPEATRQDLIVTPYSDTGKAFSPINIPMSADQKKYSNTAAGIGLPAETAWLRIEAGKCISGFELFGSTDAKQLGGYTGVCIKSSHGIMPKLDKSGWSGIALVNCEEKPATVTLKARDDEGRLIASRIIPIDASAKILGTPQTLFPNADLSSATYISYQSNSELVGFQLNGEALFLDGLPALNR